MSQLFTLLLLIVGGCQSPPAPDIPADVASATLVQDPIRFQTIGAPTDVPSDLPGTLTVADAVKTALQNDPQLQAAIARVRGALADAKQSRLLPNPVVDVALRYPMDGGKTIIDAGLSADLVALLKLKRSMSAADNRLRAAGREAIVSALDVVTRIQEVYLAVQSLDAEIEILHERERINRRLLELANDRVAAGESPRLDSLTLEAQQAELETASIQKEAARIDQRLMLARLLGRPSSSADWQLAKWEAPASIVETERPWIESALTNRPEIQAKSWELAALGDDQAVAGLGIFEGAGIGVASEKDPDWSVGPAITLPIPIFDIGQARKERASAEVVAARHELTVARRQTVEDVRRAFASLALSKRALAKVQQQLLPAQEKRRAQAELAYKNGLADVTTLLIAEQDLQTSREKLIEVQRDVSLATVRLQRAAGGAGVVQHIQSQATTRQAPDDK